MKKKAMVWIVIVSLVVVVAIGTCLFLNSRSKKSGAESIPAETPMENPETVDQSKDRFHISQEELDKMTDEELLQAVIDYPYLIDIFLTDHPEDAVPSLKENCDALKELVARGTAVETIDSYLAQHENITTAEEEILRDQLIVIRDNL